jgi:phosphate transport system protein
MTIHFHRATEKLKASILTLGGRVEDNVRQAVLAVETLDASVAKGVIESDTSIDTMEVEIEEECLKLLALYQPVAVDLRFIVAVLKINNDLERIGDLAVNIAELAARRAIQEPDPVGFDLSGMAEKTRRMLKKSLDSLVRLDPALARDVCGDDSEVDRMNHQMADLVKEGIKHASGGLEGLIQFMLVARHLERIADHSTNIAEDVIYMVEGVIVRHNADKPSD